MNLPAKTPQDSRVLRISPGTTNFPEKAARAYETQTKLSPAIHLGGVQSACAREQVSQDLGGVACNCFPWYAHLHPIYSRPLAVIDRRTPRRCQRCEASENVRKGARPRQWGTVAAPTDYGQPAGSLGKTMVEAAAQYGRPLHLIRQVYILGRDECSAPIGRRDAWGVFYADPKALKAVLADADAQRAVAAMETRLARRIAARMARFGKVERPAHV